MKDRSNTARSAASFPPTAAPAAAQTAASQTGWRRELLWVDFRNAAWVWVGLVCGIAGGLWLQPWPFGFHGSWVAAYLLTGLFAPAVVTRIFCADFAEGTHERLMAMPVARLLLWRVRLGLAAVLLFTPVLLMALWAGTNSYDETKIVFVRICTAITCLLAWSAFSFGPLLSLLLQKPILAWTMTVVVPLACVLLASFVQTLLGITDFPSQRFPYLPIGLTVFFVIAGITAQFYAARVWRRLEVRAR